MKALGRRGCIHQGSRGLGGSEVYCIFRTRKSLSYSEIQKVYGLSSGESERQEHRT